MAKSNNSTQSKVNAEHIKHLTNIFQEVRTENYMHDYDGDFKMLGATLKRVKDYDIEVLEKVLQYFKRYGLKEVEKMQGFLIWAFKNPYTAMQPYNTIDLQKGNRRGVRNERKVKKPQSREYYDELFEQIEGQN